VPRTCSCPVSSELDGVRRLGPPANLVLAAGRPTIDSGRGQEGVADHRVVMVSVMPHQTIVFTP